MYPRPPFCPWTYTGPRYCPWWRQDSTCCLGPPDESPINHKSLFSTLIEAEKAAILFPLDEVRRYLRATITGDTNTDPFVWWQTHEKSFPKFTQYARDYLIAQPTSVASESPFSIPENLISPTPSLLESISACMLVQHEHTDRNWLVVTYDIMKIFFLMIQDSAKRWICTGTVKPL